MKNESAHKVLRQAHVSEKAAQMTQEHNQYLFQVERSATKPQIKRVVESLFEVKVDSVRVVNTRGKSLRNRWGSGRRNHMRKAYVRLAPGQHLDVESVSS